MTVSFGYDCWSSPRRIHEYNTYLDDDARGSFEQKVQEVKDGIEFKPWYDIDSYMYTFLGYIKEGWLSEYAMPEVGGLTSNTYKEDSENKKILCNGKESSLYSMCNDIYGVDNYINIMDI